METIEDIDIALIKDYIYNLISKPGHNFLDDCNKKEIEIIVNDVIQRYLNNDVSDEYSVDTVLEILIADCHYGYTSVRDQDYEKE